ncbi:MAG: hypothetical protein IT373_04315 [Polyangiaceae bacterium]|nr:hypothetical protein [Polyangiaceae bacterium]
MRWAIVVGIVSAGSIAGASCKSEVTGGDGTGGTGTTSTSTSSTGTGGTGTGGSQSSGDCQSNADCPGTECLPVTPGGWKACTDVVVEATTCGMPMMDECCTTAECAAGLCLTTPVVPYCGGIQPAEYNVCAGDECQSDASCGFGICLPAPMLGRKVRACMYAQCRDDGDCAAEPGGRCAPVEEPCCGTVSGLYCVYPSDGCRTDADCPGGYCQPGNDRASCQVGSVICPA